MVDHCHILLFLQLKYIIYFSYRCKIHIFGVDVRYQTSHHGVYGNPSWSCQLWPRKTMFYIADSFCYFWHSGFCPHISCIPFTSPQTFSHMNISHFPYSVCQDWVLLLDQMYIVYYSSGVILSSRSIIDSNKLIIDRVCFRLTKLNQFKL